MSATSLEPGAGRAGEYHPVSAGRPGQGAPTEQVEVDVKDALTGITPGVGDQPVARLQALEFGHLGQTVPLEP